MTQPDRVVMKSVDGKREGEEGAGSFPNTELSLAGECGRERR